MRSNHDPAAVRRSLAREALGYLGHGLLFGLGYLPSRHRPERRPDIHTVVFVHGLGGNRASFLPLQLYLSGKGFQRQYAYNYRSQGSIEAIAVDLKKRLDREVKGGRITLVAHSMGGLVSRVFLQELGGDRRVQTLITIGTPHLGSHAAAYVPTALGDQLSPDGPFLSHLNGLPWPERVRCVSFSMSEDLMVLPPRHALPPFAEHITMEDRGHLDVLFSLELYREIYGVLLEQERAAAM